VKIFFWGGLKIKMKLDFFAAVEVGEELFFSAWLINGIFKMNRNTEKVTYIGRVAEEEIEYNLYCFAHYHAGKVYFIPKLGKYIAVLDVADEHIYTIALPEREHICGEIDKFAKVLYNKNSLWLIPRGFDALLQLDLMTETWSIYDNWPEGVVWDSREKLQFYTGALVSNHICMLQIEVDFFVSFDTERKTMHKYEWKYPKNAFEAMVVCEGSIWFFPTVQYTHIIKYNIATETTEQIEVQENVEEDIVCLYTQPIVRGNKIIRPPYQAKHWLVLDTITNEVKKIACAASDYPLCQAAVFFKDGILATSGISGRGEYISKDLQVVKEISIDGSEAIQCYLQDRMAIRGANEEPIIEDVVTLKEYVEVIKNTAIFDFKEIGKKSIGERIFNKIIK